MPANPEAPSLKRVPDTTPSRLKYLKALHDTNALPSGSTDWLEMVRARLEKKPEPPASDKLV